MNKVLFVGALLAVAGVAQAGPEGNGTIQVEVGGLRSGRGSVVCQLFAAESGFPETGGTAVTTVPIERPKGGLGGRVLNATCTFTRLAVGTWAVAVFHDENGDGKMNKNLFGIPSEGYGVSNNVTHPFSAPKWSESTFALVAGATKVVPIALHY